MRKILIIAGEASGDLQGSLLVHQLNAKRHDLEFSGIGGPLLQREGMKLLYSINQMSFLGIWEVLKHLVTIQSIFHHILNYVQSNQIRTVILIDYPGFNLRMACRLKKMNCQVIYYISPQLWAWGSHRVSKIKRYVDLLIVILPFEEDFYRRHNITAHFVGHPLIEKCNQPFDPDYFKLKYHIPADSILINLQPGSRMQEVSQLMPVYVEFIHKMIHHPACLFLIPRATTIPAAVMHDYLSDPSLPVRIIEAEDYYTSLAITDLVITASGTAGLEAAIFEKPMAIVYKVNPLTYYLAKLLIKIPYLGIANIIAGKRIVPEFIQSEFTADHLLDFCQHMLQHPDDYQRMKLDLQSVRIQLGETGAATRAAQLIENLLEQP